MTTAEIPLTDKQAAHVAGLEAIIQRKNERIAHLEEQVALGGDSPAAQRRVRKAYKQGWGDAANRMMNATHQAAIALSHLRSDAFETILDGERKNRTETE